MCHWVRETILDLYLFIFTFWVRNQWPRCWLWICIMQSHSIFQLFFFLLPDCFCLTHCTSWSASKEWFPSWKDCGDIHHGTRLEGEKGINLNIWIDSLNVFTFISSVVCLVFFLWFGYAFPLNALLKGLPVKSFCFVFLHKYSLSSNIAKFWFFMSKLLIIPLDHI